MLKRFFVLCFGLVVLLSTPARAEFVLQLPLGAKETYSRIETGQDPLVPVKVWDGASVPTVKGPDHIRRSTWAFGGEQTLNEVQKNILGQLESSDYEIILFCQTQECGGFDFRFGIDVVSEPDMRVDLRDFRFVTARQTTTQTPAYVTFLLSKSPVSVYVQMTEYSTKTEVAPAAIQDTATKETDVELASVPPERPFGEPIILEGLIFENGSAQLADDPNAVIASLAKTLKNEESLNVPEFVGFVGLSGVFLFNFRPWLPGGQSSAPNGN